MTRVGNTAAAPTEEDRARRARLQASPADDGTVALSGESSGDLRSGAADGKGRLRAVAARVSARVLRPILNLLTQGITPERISLCIAVGLAIAICPILGVATFLCTVAAAGLRLNLPLIQGVNYAATPLQWMLILPYVRAGELLFGGEPMPFSLAELFSRFEEDWLGFFSDFWLAGLKALGAWVLTAPLIVGAVYVLLTPALRRLRRTRL